MEWTWSRKQSMSIIDAPVSDSSHEQMNATTSYLQVITPAAGRALDVSVADKCVHYNRQTILIRFFFYHWISQREIFFLSKNVLIYSQTRLSTYNHRDVCLKLARLFMRWCIAWDSSMNKIVRIATITFALIGAMFAMVIGTVITAFRIFEKVSCEMD